MSQIDRLAIEVPRFMRTLPRDSRGLRVPYIVLWDKSGKPQFTINDQAKVAQCIKKRLCAICGKAFGPGGMWFIGGSRCFLHPRGAFLDSPTHLECGTYALQVCPFLAARSYSKRIDGAKLAPEDMPDGLALVRANYIPPALPERFGFGLARQFTAKGVVLTVDQWDYVEWWSGGKQVNAPDSPYPDAPIIRFAKPV